MRYVLVFDDNGNVENVILFEGSQTSLERKLEELGDKTYKVFLEEELEKILGNKDNLQLKTHYFELKNGEQVFNKKRYDKENS